MATEAILSLEQLRCIKLQNTESRTEPYIWPVLIRVDDNTISTPQLVSVISPALGNARVVIKDSMRAGDVASIPLSVGTLRTRFDDNLSTRRLLLVVALLENDETPETAMRAGFQAFVSEVGLAIADNLLALSAANEDEEKALIDVIQKRVTGRVKAATENALTAWEKAKILAGILNLDDATGSAFTSFGKPSLVSAPVNLAFETKGSILGIPTQTRYEIQGRLQVKPVVVSRCQPQVNAVAAAQTAVHDIENEIAELQAQLHGQGDEPPLPKAFIVAEIRRIRQEELGPAMLALQQARAALQACRDLGNVVLGNTAVEGVLAL